MRVRLIVVSVGLAAVIGAVAWLNAKPPAAPPRQPAATGPTVPPTTETTMPGDLGLPREPPPPPAGTDARRIFLAAMISGDERGLQTVREALQGTQGCQGSTNSEYLRKLTMLQREYTERLERHRREMASAQ